MNRRIQLTFDRGRVIRQVIRATDYQSNDDQNDLHNTVISTDKVAGLNIHLYYSPRHNDV